ncbi:MAG: hypothetical protein JWN93_575 [Hyphomicrobiales bacterium]|nr:hypothetical protein [Hyphomicrobiales bacterium]
MRGSALENQIEKAETLAFVALGFLAADEDRLNAFLAVSGLDPGALREAAAEPGFAAGVLDYVCSDDQLVLGLAAQENVTPESIGAAQRLLAGPASHDTDW